MEPTEPLFAIIAKIVLIIIFAIIPLLLGIFANISTKHPRAMFIAELIFLPVLLLPSVNSILHGFDEMKSGGFIRVSTFMEDGDDRLCLAIEDNGRGMPECDRKFVQSVISDLRAGIRRPDKNRQGGGHGEGVQNVLIRMWSFYGTGMGAELVTAPGKGTKYLFRLPYPKEKEGDSCGS